MYRITLQPLAFEAAQPFTHVTPGHHVGIAQVLSMLPEEEGESHYPLAQHNPQVPARPGA